MEYIKIIMLGFVLMYTAYTLLTINEVNKYSRRLFSACIKRQMDIIKSLEYKDLNIKNVTLRKYPKFITKSISSVVNYSKLYTINKFICFFNLFANVFILYSVFAILVSLFAPDFVNVVSIIILFALGVIMKVYYIISNRKNSKLIDKVINCNKVDYVYNDVKFYQEYLRNNFGEVNSFKAYLSIVKQIRIVFNNMVVLLNGLLINDSNMNSVIINDDVIIKVTYNKDLDQLLISSSDNEYVVHEFLVKYGECDVVREMYFKILLDLHRKENLKIIKLLSNSFVN